MTDWLVLGNGTIVGLAALVLVFAVLKAAQTLRHEKSADRRGSAPGKGYHVIQANYHSGGGGGGHSAEFRVPKNPQEYSRLFVPKDAEPKDPRS